MICRKGAKDKGRFSHQGVLMRKSVNFSQLSVKYVVGRSPAEESGFFSQGDILTSVDGQVYQTLSNTSIPCA
jgi:hypothetical protein